MKGRYIMAITEIFQSKTKEERIKNVTNAVIALERGKIRRREMFDEGCSEFNRIQLSQSASENFLL